MKLWIAVTKEIKQKKYSKLSFYTILNAIQWENKDKRWYWTINGTYIHVFILFGGNKNISRFKFKNQIICVNLQQTWSSL